MRLFRNLSFFSFIFGLIVFTVPLEIGAVTLPYDNTNPVIHSNDGGIDNYTLELAMALASAGDIKLVGVIGELASKQQYQDIIGKARRSGMINLPNAVSTAGGATAVLQMPSSGFIKDTTPLNTEGSRRIVQEAKKATAQKPLVVCTGGPITAVADAYLLDNSIADKVIVVALLGSTTNMIGYNGNLDGWADYIVLKKLRYVQIPENLAIPSVPKNRLAGNEIPKSELKRFMVDKNQQNVDLPGDIDIDGQPFISVMRSDYVQSVKKVSFGGWVSVKPNHADGIAQVPKLKDDPNGQAIVVTKASTSIATSEWWRALSNPAAYTGTVVNQAPFSGVPSAIPGKVQAEKFDWGGEGFAFFDTRVTGWPKFRIDNQQRTDANNKVWSSIEKCSDTGGGFNMTEISSGEWLEYTINVKQSGTYAIGARVAASSSGKKFHIKFGGVNKTGAIQVPNTGGRQKWKTVTIPDITLNAGKQVMRIAMDSGGFNLNYIDFTFQDNAPPPISLPFTDAFSSDTISNYTLVVTDSRGGSGQFSYDAQGKRARLLTGDNVALQFSRNVPSPSTGTFKIDFNPIVKYPLGGRITLRLKKDDNNYYEMTNSNGYGPGLIKKVIAGQIVESVPFLGEYEQMKTYSISMSFSPSTIAVSAFGEQATLSKNNTAIAIKVFEITSSQQDAYYDNIMFSSQSTDIVTPKPPGGLVIK